MKIIKNSTKEYNLKKQIYTYNYKEANIYLKLYIKEQKQTKM